MTSRVRDPLANRSSQENGFGTKRIDGLQAHNRVVLGVLQENGSSRVNCQDVPVICGKAVGDASAHSVPRPCALTCQSTSTVVHEAESFYMHTDTTLMVAEDVQLFDASEDVFLGSTLDASMQSLPEDEPILLQDVLSMAEYAEDIHRHLRESEVRCRPKPGYMKKQPDITNCMRLILVDWLVEVGEEYKLCSETIYLAVNYLDRFLSCMSVLRGKLQLVGTAAILLAAKYEEIYPPDVDEFVYITDDTYTKKQLLRMEHLLLKVLSFDMTVPTTHQFLMQYIIVEPVCSKTANLALYVAELSLLEVDPFLHHLPSKMAAAAYCLANYTVNRAFWPESLYAFTGYTLTQLCPCMKELHKLYLGARGRPQQAIREKYKCSKYSGVALMNPVESLPLP